MLIGSACTTLCGSYTCHAGTAALRWGKTYQEQLQQQHQQKQHALEPRGLACWPGWPCWAGAVPPAADSCCTDICLFRISIRSDPMGWRHMRVGKVSTWNARKQADGNAITSATCWGDVESSGSILTGYWQFLHYDNGADWLNLMADACNCLLSNLLGSVLWLQPVLRCPEVTL